MTAMTVRGALLPDRSRRDLRLDSGRVTAVAPPGELPAGRSELDLSGYLLLPAPAEPHAHLDKAGTWDLADAPPCDLPSAVSAWRRYAEYVTEDDVRTRARRTLDDMLANGVTAVRTHADVLPGADPLRGLRALVGLREELRGRLDLQVAVLHTDAPDEVLCQAAELGVDLLGGCPHLSVDPAAAIDRVLRLAERYGVGVDLHADENLSPSATDLRLLADAVRRRGFAGPVTAGHCVSLGATDPQDAMRIAKETAQAGIGVVTLPITNLYLQGRDHPTRTPRGLTAVRTLLDAGVTLAAGGDNIRDPFNPVGRADPLETAGLLVTAGHLTLEEAVHAVTNGSRAVLGMPAAGPQEGAVADLLAVRAGSLSEALGAACPDRIVFKAGRIISRTTVVREFFEVDDGHVGDIAAKQ
ncbi:amidohydrolase family protein [Streptomyces himalayensis]|uniref:amidohydrolase family protein n=1 Tax=Streptomyces himalayensis TaxID=2820085 RepID=UPI001C698A71|nr:amidohydrolase family protein [Streptomyces himalayensis]